MIFRCLTEAIRKPDCFTVVIETSIRFVVG